MLYIQCKSEQIRNDEQIWLGEQHWCCNDCQRRFTRYSTSAFINDGVLNQVIALAVRY